MTVSGPTVRATSDPNGTVETSAPRPTTASRSPGALGIGPDAARAARPRSARACTSAVGARTRGARSGRVLRSGQVGERAADTRLAEDDGGDTPAARSRAAPARALASKPATPPGLETPSQLTRSVRSAGAIARTPWRRDASSAVRLPALTAASAAAAAATPMPASSDGPPRRSSRVSASPSGNATRRRWGRDARGRAAGTASASMHLA